MSIKKDLQSYEDIIKQVSEEKSLINKILYAYHYELDKQFYINEALHNLEQYVDELKNFNDSQLYDLLLFNNSELLSKLYFEKCPDSLKKAVWIKLNNIHQIDMEDFKSLQEEFKIKIVESLIEKNQLKGSYDFIKNKIEKNELMVKVDENGNLIQSIGFKTIDDSLLEQIGHEYSNYKELGYAQNNQDLESYRENLNKVKNLFHIGLVAFIREDNKAALRITKRFGFKEIKKFKSPYSSNILIALVLD